MSLLLAFLLLADPADKPAAAPRPIEEVLAAKEKPGDEKIIVTTHLLIHKVEKGKEVSAKFVDTKPSANVNLKLWDEKLKELKPETTILVTGELHFGEVSGGTPSIRYKVVDIKGKTYNDHQHWRTDKAIYITHPSYEVVEATDAKDAKETKE